MTFSDVRKRILAKIKPTSAERARLDRAIGDVLGRLWQASVSLEHEHALCVGGSTAKDTFLRGNHDVDVFVRFDPRYPNDVLSDVLEEILVAAGLPFERVHGSRDYYHIQYKKLLFELVPVRNISTWKEAQNVTDMSPLHVAYVTQRLTPTLRDEIRLAKQYCKAAHCYGAESYINGFSGHVIDLLVLQYGGFLKLVRAAAQWPARGMVVFDPEAHHKDPLSALDEAKLHSPLVIVDPVQPKRNAAAALSREKYVQFIETCKKFIEASKGPTRSSKKSSRISSSVGSSLYTFFIVSHLTKEKIAKNMKKKFGIRERDLAKRIAIIETRALPGKPDNVGTKCLKAFEHVVRHARKNHFTIVDSGWEYDEKKQTALGFVLVAEARLPPTYQYTGPPVHVKKDAARFRAKHQVAKNTVIEKDGRLYATVKHAHRTIKQLARATIKDDYVKNRVKNVRVV